MKKLIIVNYYKNKLFCCIWICCICT